jgi:hypothetical protein
VPGRPAWHSPLTIVRFFATAAALGAPVTGHREIAVAGVAVALAATIANWARLWRTDQPPWRGAVRLELRWFRTPTVLRLVSGVAAIVVVVAGAPLWLAFVLAAVAESLGRWLFFVAVVPMNMPGAFWRGAAGTHR